MFSLCCLQIPKKVCFLYKFISGQLVISLHLGKLLSTGQPGFGSLQPANPKGQVCEPPLLSWSSRLGSGAKWKILASVSSAFSCPGELEEGPFRNPVYSLCSWSLACAALNFSNQHSFQAAFVEMKQVREAVFIPSHAVKGSNVFPSALYCIFGSLSNRLTRISLLSRMETLRLTLAYIFHRL